MTSATVSRIFAPTGWALVGLGALLFLPMGAFAGGLTLPAPFADGSGPYLAATAGSALLGWGAILLTTARSAGETRRAVALGAGVGFLALSLTRLWAALADAGAFRSVAISLPGEAVLLFALSILFLQIGVGFWGRLVDGFRSLCAAPVWVQVWVWAFLLTANGAALYLAATTRHPLPGWAAVGFVFVVLTNMTLVLYERGISRLASLPHLIPWVPLQVYAGYWLFARGDALAQTPLIHAFAWFYFIVIGISNVFDAYDTVRWFRGERQVLGADVRPPAQEPRR